MFESHVSIIVELCISFVLCLLILFYYSRKRMNLIIFFTSLVCWFMNLFLIILIPYDVYYSQKINQTIPKSSENVIYYGYRVSYWILFILSWFIIPIMKEYECSGEFTILEKLKYSLKSNIKYFAILGAVGIFGIIYCIIKFGANMTFYLVKNFSLIFGIFFFFFLLSYGIIKYPKTLYEKYNFQKQIKYLEWKATNFIDKLQILREHLINSYSQLNSTIKKYENIKQDNKGNEKENNLESKSEEKDNLDTDSDNMKEKTIKQYINQIKNNFEDFKQNALTYGIDIKLEFFDRKEHIEKYDDLIAVNQKINSLQNDCLRLKSRLRNCYMRWARLNSVIYYTNGIIDNSDGYEKMEEKNNETNENSLNENKIEVKDNKNKEEEKNLEEEGFFPLDGFNDNKVINCYIIKKYIYFSLLIIFIIAGVITVLWEFYIVCGFRFIYIYKNLENIVVIHFMVLIPLIYLISMSNYTLFKIKLSAYLFMYGPRQTDSISLITFTSYLSRIYFAICFNYMQAVNQFSEKKYNTEFEKFFDLDDYRSIPSICRYSPIFLFIFIGLFYFDIPARIMHCCGKNLFEFNTEERNINIDKGHKYLMTLNKKLNGKALDYNDYIMFETMD